MKKIGYIIIALLLANNLQAQNFEDDIDKMNKAYAKYNSMSMEVLYQVFFDGNALPDQSEKGWVKKDGKKIYSNEFAQETIINDKYILNIDHDGKMMEITNKIENYKPQKTVKIEADSLLKIFKTVRYKGLEGDSKHYYLEAKEGQFTSVEIWLNSDTYLMEKMQTNYRNKMEVEEGKWSKVISVIEYNNIKINPALSANTFSESEFVKIVDKRVTLTAKYKNYELINHLNL